MTVNSRSSSFGCNASRIAAAARKPVGSFPKSSTARRVGRDCATAVDVSSRHSDANKGRAYDRGHNCKAELIKAPIAQIQLAGRRQAQRDAALGVRQTLVCRYLDFYST